MKDAEEGGGSGGNVSIDLSNYAEKDEVPTIDQFNELSKAVGMKANEEHKHHIGDTTNLQEYLLQKADKQHKHVAADITDLQTTLSNKADSNHTHTMNDITGIEIIGMKNDYYSLKYYKGLPENMFRYNDTIEADDIGKNSSDMFQIFDKNGVNCNNTHKIRYVKFIWNNILTITTTYNKDANNWYCDYSNTTFNMCFFSIPSVPETMLGCKVEPNTIEIYVDTNEIVNNHDAKLNDIESEITNVQTKIKELEDGFVKIGDRFISYNAMIANQAITSDVLLCDDIDDTEVLNYQYDGRIPNNAISLKTRLNELSNIEYTDDDTMFIHTANIKIGNNIETPLFRISDNSMGCSSQIFSASGLILGSNIDHHNKEYLDKAINDISTLTGRYEQSTTIINDKIEHLTNRMYSAETDIYNLKNQPATLSLTNAAGADNTRISSLETVNIAQSAKISELETKMQNILIESQRLETTLANHADVIKTLCTKLNIEYV